MPVPTDAMATEAQRGLDWREEYGRGGTEVGVARARDIINKRDLSDDTIGRMVSYFARHEVDKEGEGFSPGEDGYPSAGRIAWALWGGDPGKAWADREWAKIQEGKAMTLRHHAAQLSVKSMGEGGEFSGYASVFGVKDSYQDIVMPGAFVKSLAQHAERGTSPALLWQHNSQEPIGVWTRMEEDKKGLYVEGRLLVDDDPLARRAYAHIKAGSVSGLSIGFRTIGEIYDQNLGAMKLTEIELWETSIVTFPANVAARVESVRACDTIKSIRDFEAALRDELGFSVRQAKRLASGGWSAFQDRDDHDDELISKLNQLIHVLR
jgi:HK97 family phage prohead protease